MRLSGYALLATIGCGTDSGPSIDNTLTHSDAGADARPSDAGSSVRDAAVEDASTQAQATRYVTTSRHSPYSSSVVQGLKAILAGGNRATGAFSKIGASNTVNTGFLTCLAGSDIKLESNAALEPTRVWFNVPLSDGGSPYARTSLAATVGWQASDVVEGSPNAATQELSMTNGAFALISLGTNDSFEGGLDSFDKNIRKLVDQLISMHVVPILSTIPPRADSVSADRLAREVNALIWTAGESRQIPVINVYDALVPLGDGALVSDGIHLSVYSAGGSKACWFTADGLKKGHNVRNLLTLEGLERAKRFVVDGLEPEPSVAPLSGSGTLADPIAVANFPFAAEGDTSKAASAIDRYSCGTQNESGGEIAYRFTVGKRGAYRFRVIDDEGVDVDVHLLTAADANACKARHDRLLEETLDPGTFYLVIDTFSGPAKAGRYRVTAIAL
jgi:hypothetical protein